MPYRLKARRSISSEVRRIIDKQLVLAVEELHGLGDPRGDDSIHEARRHVKKVRALLRLVQPSLGNPYYGANRRMRLANRLLAPVADGEGVVDTITNLTKKYGTRLNRHTLTATRAALVDRSARIDRKAKLDRVLPKVARILRAQRRGLAGWTLNTHGFRAIAPGLEKSYRRARNAMARAKREPSAANYHRWRRRVKDLWFQVRLVERRCANSLIGDQRRLETLDGYLGEHHNVALLERALLSEAIVSRRQTARALHILRRYQALLRQRALAMGRGVLHEKPRHFVRRIKWLWRATKAGERATGVQTPWRHAA